MPVSNTIRSFVLFGWYPIMEEGREVLANFCRLRSYQNCQNVAGEKIADIWRGEGGLWGSAGVLCAHHDLTVSLQKAAVKWKCKFDRPYSILSLSDIYCTARFTSYSRQMAILTVFSSNVKHCSYWQVLSSRYDNVWVRFFCVCIRMSSTQCDNRPFFLAAFFMTNCTLEFCTACRVQRSSYFAVLFELAKHYTQLK